MSNNSDLQRVVDLVAVPMPSLKTPAPGSAPVSRITTTKIAIRHCCTARQRAYEEFSDDSEYRANKEACAAYCKAMPVLAGEKGIRDFIACAAHGVVIGAIPETRGGQLFYAAQVAISALQRERKSSESTE
jgi:hypothetical protein